MNLDFLKEFKNARLLTVGESGIDEYIWGETWRISPEAPVPIVEVESQEHKLGLTANVARIVHELGASVSLVTIRGEDADGELLSKMIEQAGIVNSHVLCDPSRPTLRKVRVIAGKQHVVRVDYEKKHPLAPSLSKRIREILCDELKRHDGVIVEDYGKGFFVPEVMEFVKTARQMKKPVFVDPSRHASLNLYRDTTLLTPNLLEAEILCGLPHHGGRNAGLDDQRLTEMATKIMNDTNADHSIITCGQWGMVSLSKNSRILNRIPTFARQVYDVTGAGDTVIGVLSLVHVLGLPLETAMKVANAAAGIVVGKVGTATIAPEELRAELIHLEEKGILT